MTYKPNSVAFTNLKRMTNYTTMTITQIFFAKVLRDEPNGHQVFKRASLYRGWKKYSNSWVDLLDKLLTPNASRCCCSDSFTRQLPIVLAAYSLTNGRRNYKGNSTKTMSMGLIPAAAILAIGKIFRTQSLKLKCLGTIFGGAKQKFSVPQDSTWPPCD